jgi:hypothetical protein
MDGCENGHPIVQALRKLDIYAGPYASGANHDVNLIPDRSDFLNKAVDDDSVGSGYLLTLPPKDVNCDRTIHLREDLIDQPVPIMAIGPPGKISEVPEAKMPTGLTPTEYWRLRKQRWYIKCVQPRDLGTAPSHVGCGKENDSSSAPETLDLIATLFDNLALEHPRKDQGVAQLLNQHLVFQVMGYQDRGH